MADIIENNFQTVRDDILLEDLVLVDGQPGCGKTLFSSIIASMERVELLKYSTQLENMCALKFLGKVSDDAVQAILRIEMDLAVYETMMSRNVNFRPTDLSGAFKDVDFWTYVRRLFSRGDETIPDRIREEKPIMHFATHNLLAFSEPVFESFGDIAKIVEVVRHPLYMVIQQALNHENWSRAGSTARQFHLYTRYEERQMPYYITDRRDFYINASPVEKAIYEIDMFYKMTEAFKRGIDSARKKQILTIPFERFVLDPFPYMKKIECLLKTTGSGKTSKVMKRQNVPRKKISDGIPLAIYKRCGWTPPEKELNEQQELEKRRQYVIEQGASKEAIQILDRICGEYEENYLGGASE